MDGHVAAVDTYQVALRRELWQELHVSLVGVAYSLLGHFTPHAHEVSAFMRMYRIPMLYPVEECL